MKKYIVSIGLFFLFSYTTVYAQPAQQADFIIAVGSCNKTEVENPFWDDILSMKPDVFIWGGDNIYADTRNIKKLERMYQAQNEVPAYAKLKNSVPILATWDDHDYGLNDGGKFFDKKKESQQAFLDFLNVPNDDERRKREGVYHAQTMRSGEFTIHLILLDTRYHRTDLTESQEPKKRYKPNAYGTGTILGEEQWQWLEDQLLTEPADYTVIVSSIQVLSGEHGFETWANFPHEVDRLIQLLKKSNVKNPIVVTGDRHISEFSKLQYPGLSYPLIDFTSSGLTHSYTDYSGEPNRFRVGEVISKRSYGAILFDFKKQRVTFQIRGDDGKIFTDLVQDYN